LLTASQAQVIFAEGRIRKPEEQKQVLQAKGVQTRAAKKTATADPKTGKIRIGRYRFTRGELLAVISELFPPPDDETGGRERIATVHLSEEEHRRFRLAAADAGISGDRLFRLALHNAGIL
jgi:hypothetical protein